MTPFWIAIFAILFTFLMTVLGAAFVFFIKSNSISNTYPIFFGMSAGIMLAASIWSLLLPSLEAANGHFGKLYFLPTILGMIIGALFLSLIDFIPMRKNAAMNDSTKYKSAMKLFLAISLHNIPEGLAVGFALGAAMSGGAINYLTALGLTIGIGLQNIPEGAAVSIPLKSVLKRKSEAFLLAVASGLIEVFFAFLGYFLTAYLSFLNIWLPGFAAGAMMYVVFEELLPEIKTQRRVQVGVWSTLLGFLVMVIFDCLFA